MKHWFYALIALLVTELAVADRFPPVTVEKINDRVYAMLGPSDVPNKKNHGYVNNILVIIGNTGVILVDAGSHKAVASHVDNAIKTVTDKPITHVLITHHHSDHHLGVEYFSGAQIYATKFCAEQIKENALSMVEGMQQMSGADLSEAKAVEPQMTIVSQSHKAMEIDGIKLELIATNTAHTNGDLVIWLPDDSVLASGDILVHSVNPNFNDGNLADWIGVVNDEILALPFKTIMPGHGSLMQRDDVIEFRDLITDFYQTVEKIYISDGFEYDVRKSLDLEKWKSFSRFDEMMGRNINKVWLEVEEANF